MTTRLPAELRGEALAGKAPAGGEYPPQSPAGAPDSSWAVIAVFAEFAQAVGVQLRTDRRGGKRGDGHERLRLPQGLVGRPLSPDYR